MLSRLKEFFKKRGTWVEPYGEYLFLAKVKFTIYHTTFFLKDYEINSLLYLIGTDSIKNPKEEFEKFKESTKKILNFPPDHYASYLCLLCLKGDPPLLYASKSVWLGIRGKVEWGILTLKEGEVKAPSQLKNVEKFLTSICFEG